jgi:nitrate/nitrite transporter NarK
MPTMSTISGGSEHHPTAWYAEMSSAERKTFWACVGGWVLDAMDVQMFSFAIPAIIAAFAITNADAGLIGTATLLSSALGGWCAGALSDRVGRVRMLQITIACFAIFTFLCGFAQSYAQLFIFRALMGFGFGGEWTAAAVLIGEVIQAEHRGKAVGAPGHRGDESAARWHAERGAAGRTIDRRICRHCLRPADRHRLVAAGD